MKKSGRNVYRKKFKKLLMGENSGSIYYVNHEKKNFSLIDNDYSAGQLSVSHI